MNKVVKKLIQKGKSFTSNNCNGSKLGPLAKYVDTNSNVILSSVHGINHYNKDGEPKLADLYTGELSTVIHEKTGANLLINMQKDSYLKKIAGSSLVSEIFREMKDISSKTIFDIHGAKDNLDYDIFIGTHLEEPNNEQKKIISEFTKLSKEYGFKTKLNDPRYAARGELTVTSQVIKLGCKRALQFEFTRSCRDYFHNPEKVVDVINLMSEFIKSLNARPVF